MLVLCTAVSIMYLKSFWTNVVFTIILFILVHVDKSVARKERGINPKKLLKYDDDEISGLKQKRTSTYQNPCESEAKYVPTHTLDKPSCPTCTYYPKTLKEVKCRTKNNMNVRGKASCKYFAGDCLQMYATIRVVKRHSNRRHSYPDVDLKVGCACKLPKY